MKFKFQNGQMVEETGQNIVQEMRKHTPLSTAFIVDIPSVKKSVKRKSQNFLKNSNFAMVSPMMAMGVATGGVGSNMAGAGVFWDTFLTYIFPWMLDIAKVYCLVRIAQAFYKERRGGSDSGTGFGALVEHGKWYIVFWCLPILVELIDGVGHRMYDGLHDNITTNK